MNALLKKIKDINSEHCVSILLNTHRTSPENKADSIRLKNLIAEAEKRLLGRADKKVAQDILTRTHELAEQIDHNYNLESLVLFVNESIAEYVRLPLTLDSRVIIDTTFATRDLIRALHSDVNYFILVLSQRETRLIEVFNDQVVAEDFNLFPVENRNFFSTSKIEIANAKRQTNLVAEYFKLVDKKLLEVRKENPLPVLICTEESNFYEYLKITDQKHSIYERFLNQNRLDEEARSIAAAAWPIIKKNQDDRLQNRKNELLQAVSSNKYLSDVNEIWQAINQGRIQTLFIEKNLFQPGIITDSGISFVSENERDTATVTDDIYDEMIELNMNFGGDVVFLEAGELNDFQGFGAVTRY